MCLKITSISVRKIKAFIWRRDCWSEICFQHIIFFRTQTNFCCDTTACKSVSRRKCSTLWTLGGKRGKKRHHSSLIKIFQKLSLFIGKAKRFTEPVGETKPNKPAHGLNPSLQAHGPKVEVLKGRVSAYAQLANIITVDTAVTFWVQDLYIFLGSCKRQIAFLVVARTRTTHRIGRKESIWYPFTIFQVWKCFELIFPTIFSGINGDFSLPALTV